MKKRSSRASAPPVAADAGEGPDADRYLVACASAAGKAHRDAHKNNQDAAAVCSRGESPTGPDIIALCVSDGCSALVAAEVGAQLTARRAVYSAVEWAEAHPQSLPSGAMEFVFDDVVSMIQRVSIAVGGANRADDVVADTLLSTMLVALVTPQGAAIFGVGDGVIAKDGDVRIERSGTSGTPYPAYRVRALGPSPSMKLFFVAGPEDWSSLTLATDGAEPLFSKGRTPATSLSRDAWLRASALRWELEAQVHEAAERSQDDVTVAIIARRAK
ncbi:MAG: protein phosphatase 2C domain-containing protein [Myxococcales bacterium]|nr:protein phosphatase 2C domain-containing protein [Myxococcales bacterium]